MSTIDQFGIVDPREELIAANPELRARSRAMVPKHLDVETTTMLLENPRMRMPMPVLLERMNDLITSTDSTDNNQGYYIALQLLPYFTPKAPAADYRDRDRRGEEYEIQKVNDKIARVINQSSLSEDAKQKLTETKVLPFAPRDR